MCMSYGCYDICMVFRVARHVEPCVCHNDHKTYTWNDVILYKRSMIRVFFCLTFTVHPIKNPFKPNFGNPWHVVRSLLGV